MGKNGGSQTTRFIKCSRKGTCQKREREKCPCKIEVKVGKNNEGLKKARLPCGIPLIFEVQIGSSGLIRIRQY